MLKSMISNITYVEDTDEIKKVSCSIISFEWNIPNISNISMKTDYSIRSPAFFFHGIWHLLLYPSWNIVNTVERFFFIYIEQESPIFPDCLIRYTVEIRCNYGSREKISNGEKVFKGSGRTMLCHKHSLTFQRILQNRHRILTDDTLRISCTLRTTQALSFPKAIPEFQHIVRDGYSQTDKEMSKDTTEMTLDKNSGTVGVENLATQLKDLLLIEKDFDTTIKVKDREFHAHKLILGVRSPVFDSMFRHDTTERNSGVVTILDCDPVIFQDFLVYLYSGRVENLSMENVFGLHALADKYDTQEVKSECVKFMINNFSLISFCDIITLALIHEEHELFKAATEFFVKNSKKIGVTVTWQRFLKEYPLEANELYLKALESSFQPE